MFTFKYQLPSFVLYSQDILKTNCIRLTHTLHQHKCNKSVASGKYRSLLWYRVPTSGSQCKETQNPLFRTLCKLFASVRPRIQIIKLDQCSENSATSINLLLRRGGSLSSGKIFVFCQEIIVCLLASDTKSLDNGLQGPLVLYVSGMTYYFFCTKLF